MIYKNFNFANEVNSWVNKYKSYFPSDSDTDKTFLQAINLYTASANPLFNNALRHHKQVEYDDLIY